MKGGKCHFTYISRLEASGPDEGSASVPVVISFLAPNTGEFDQELYHGESVYLKTDGSVATTRLSKEGTPLARGSNNLPLFQNGPGTIWGTRTPILHPPLPFPTQRNKSSNNTGLFVFTKISCVLFIFYQLCRVLVAIWKRTMRRITPTETL